MNNKMQNDSLISTAERTLKLVELFLNHPEGLTPQEILPHLGISRGALFLLLRTLKNAGYLEQSERRGRYRAGPRLTAWRTTSSEFHQNLMDAFYQEARLHPLSETLLITVPAAQGILTLAQVESHHTVRSAYPIGEVIQNPATQPRIYSNLRRLLPSSKMVIRCNYPARPSNWHYRSARMEYTLRLPCCSARHRSAGRKKISFSIPCLNCAPWQPGSPID